MKKRKEMKRNMKLSTKWMIRKAKLPGLVINTLKNYKNQRKITLFKLIIMEFWLESKI